MLKDNVFGYGELEGRMIIAEVEIDYEGEVVVPGWSLMQRRTIRS